MNTKASCARPG